MKGYIFDLDGTIYLGDEIIEGAAETISMLKHNGHKVAFLTNKSIATRHDYYEKLNKMNIDVKMSEIVNSNYIAALYLKQYMKEGQSVFLIGEEALIQEIQDLRINVTNDPERASFVLIGWDRRFTYEKINAAFQAWKAGAKVIATNPDKTCPVKGGEIPDCGAMIGAIEGSIDEKIEIVGKPSEIMIDFVIENILKLPRENCYMVGDRLETDIKMANDTGVKSILVMSGITDDEMLDSDRCHYPDYIMPNVNSILKL